MSKASFAVLATAVLFLASPAQGEAFNVRAFGAVADGKTDATDAIQKAVDAAAKAGGGKVIIPPAGKPYLVSKTIVIKSSNIELVGKGATLLRAPGTVSSSRHHTLQITGSRKKRIANVTVRGLTIDSNYWRQIDVLDKEDAERAAKAKAEGKAAAKGKKRKKAKKRRPKARGLLVTYAENVLLGDVHVRRSWVSLAFDRGAEDCEARDCTVTEWHNDAFDAAGSARNIHFLRCKAHNAHNTAEMSGHRDGGWEIEDGITNITLTDCVVEDADALAFKLRSHNSVSVNRNIRFIRCKALGYLGWYIHGRDHDTRTADVLLQDCRAAGVTSISGGVENVAIQGGSFGVVGAVQPRQLRITDAAIGALRIVATEGFDDKEKYTPQIALENVALAEPPQITGDKTAVTVVGELPRDLGPQSHFVWEGFADEERCRQRIKAMQNVTMYRRKGKLRGLILDRGKREGFVIWPVKRPAPIAQCTVGARGVVRHQGERAIAFSVSTDDGKTWTEVGRHAPTQANQVYPKLLYDLTDTVKGRREFLLKVTFQNGGRLYGLMVTTAPL